MTRAPIGLTRIRLLSRPTAAVAATLSLLALAGSTAVGAASLTGSGPPVNSTAPVVTGPARAGEMLTAAPGDWSGSAPLEYAYQWQRCGAGYADMVRGRSPIGYWRLGELSGTTAVDASGRGHGGTYGRSFILGEPGALAFDGDRAVRLGSGSSAGTVTVSHRSSLNVGNNVTYEAWVRVLRLPTSSSGADLATKGNGTLLLRILPSGVLSLRRAGGNEITRSTSALAVDGAYHHVVAVKSSSLARIYVDGTDVTGAVSNQSLANGSSAFTIAASGMEAHVDEFVLYGRALTEAEVSVDYAAGRDGVCAAIGGATADAYLLESADVGSAIRVGVTATNAAGSGTAVSAPTGVVAPPTPPVNTAPPELAGVAREAETLVASTGEWSGGKPISYAFEWRRCDSSGAGCVAIAGATGDRYPLAAADVGATVRVAVTASNLAGPATAVSAATATVAPAATAPANTAPPEVTGVARVGETLAGSAGTWSGTEPIEYGYQWRRCDAAGDACADVAEATGAEYVLTGADAGGVLRLAVTASNVAGSAVAVSEQTAVVAAAEPDPPPTAPANDEPPTVSGTPQVGETLTASPGSWTGSEPISYAYQWRRCGSGYAGLVSAAGAIGYWRLGESSGTVAVDASGLGHDGSYGGAYLLGESGALVLDGDTAVRLAPAGPAGVVSVAHRSSLNFGDAVTVEVWVRLLGLPSASSIGANIVTKGTGSLVLRILPSGELSLRRSSGGELVRSTVPLLAGGGYQHVVAVKAGTDVRLYLDGVDVTGPVSNETLTNSSESLLIANSNPAQNREGIDGFLDEFALYNRALSASEVATHRTVGREGTCEPVEGANGVSYVVGAGDVGSALDVAVTASNAAGSATAESEPTASVSAGPDAAANTTAPSITGVLQARETLTASPGTWTGTEPISYAYQWRRCDSTGACGDIMGAIAPNYVLGDDDMGTRLHVAVTASNTAGSATAVSTPTASVAYGYAGPSSLGAGERPTGSKPQSKLWWNDASWWVSMWSPASSSFSIFRLDGETQTWVDSGTLIDSRPGSRADALWDGTHLYVASHVVATCGCSTPEFGHPSRLYRYSYDGAAGRYALDAGFPVAINDTKSETLVVDKDSTGTVWATWAQSNKVYVNRTVGDDSTWGTPFALPFQEAQSLTSDDISSIVAFGGNRIGVMWSNQNANAMYFAARRDGDPAGTWGSPEIALTGTKYADDHINLHAEGSGRILVAMKTSRDEHAGAPPTDPQMVLLDRVPAAGVEAASWTMHPAGTLADDHTRPIVLVDEQSRKIHLFATAPTTPGGTIYHKVSPLDDVSFPAGLGTPFIRGSGVSLNDATSTKQSVDATSGIVVVASERPGDRYWHNYLALGG